MAAYLLIDFGTTSTKSARVDLKTGIFSRLQRHPAIPLESGVASGHHEVPLQAIYQRFDSICREYCGAHEVAGIVLCGEMHGFAVLDKGGRPLTPYVSWLDGRSLEPVHGGPSTYSAVVDALGPRFKQITGMRPRPGFPLMNLAHLARVSALPKSGFVVSMPGWLAIASEVERGARVVSPPPEHPTMLAGMALYDIETGSSSAELAEVVRELSGFTPVVGKPDAATAVAGHWQSPGGAVPIYVGVGDHQCSVLGAALPPGEGANINLGTGSQLAVIDRASDRDDVEIRPYFGDSLLYAVTHIPAGRALAEYMGFLADVAGGREDDFWEQLAAVDEREIEAATLAFDLSTFEGSRNYRGGGSVGDIVEGSLRLDNYLASLLKAFVDQYVEVLGLFDTQRQISRIVLSGGIARNLPNLSRLLARRSGYAVEPAASLDESLLGLRNLALLADERARTYVEAQQHFGRECLVEDG